MWWRLLFTLALITGAAGALFGLTALQGMPLPPWPSWGDEVLMYFVPLGLAVASFALAVIEQLRFNRIIQGLKWAEVRKIIRKARGPRNFLLEGLAVASGLTAILIVFRLMIAVENSANQLSITDAFIDSIIYLLLVAWVLFHVHWLRFCRRAVEEARAE